MRQRTYDVCIVGSGAGGGMAAYVLTQAGVDVALLEAGPEWYSTRDSAMFKQPYQTSRRGAATQARPYGEFDGCLGGWAIDGEPYTKASGTDFSWHRARMLGGRTNHWGRHSLRYGFDDFKGKSLDGLGEDWPIGYEDVAPYYDKVDRLIGIHGSAEGLRDHPDGIFLPPPRPRCHELLVKAACDRLDIPCIPARNSVLTRPHNGRPACHYCGGCMRGCATNSNFSSPEVLIKPALASGKLTLITEAMAREVTVGTDGRASGILYMDKKSGLERRVNARVVVLAASAFESTRILLNSVSARFPQGLANSTGMVGRYIATHPLTVVSAVVPALLDLPAHNDSGGPDFHVYMPWWLDNRTLDFPRGYNLHVTGGFSPPSYGFGQNLHTYARNGGGYGTSLKDEYRRYYGATVNLLAGGAMIPNDASYVDIDPITVDQWGIPVLRFHFRWSDHELNQVKHTQQTCRSILTEMGGELLSPMPSRAENYGIHFSSSELGGVRMGHDPKKSALNAHCQAHDCPNLFVADGAPFVSYPYKQPTWSILAMSWRTSDYIVQQLKQRSL